MRNLYRPVAIREHYALCLPIDQPIRQFLRAIYPVLYILVSLITFTQATLLSVKLEKPKKTALLLEALEEGDDLKVVFIPVDESGIGEYIDLLDKTESEHGIKKMD